MGWSRMLRAASSLILLTLGVTVLPVHGQNAVASRQKNPAESVCSIFRNPSIYNNKLVKVRGYVDGSFEYSLLLDERCPEASVWFAFADGSGPPQLAITVRGKGTVDSRDSKARRTPPIHVRLIRDASYEALVRYWTVSANGKACADGPPPEFPPDCTTYRVTVTFTGRVDGVSKQIHEKHLRRSARDPVDGLGFGHMGMFDAEIVVQSVENVIAVEE